ncbi:hypothetical protein ANOM_000415 [Aspergillus nomiae NRRL 13137]|uniref:Aminoglycoside phosphotransferase domain-containing protein n=1 Tax=Aspergillus nomiae NRRL (strain ATCC 15546 / NRRL 13137 / CBS 260.88 / M93) TaxID=1509407 RepID=A0A0L1JHW5_ASPN3|nr:uncharacterized protein ANOM_000415 [Aspergillus nomiae NRRL 13137]KNG91370.1 hypothetical protein ANOM_000415 [Aspergillus nomiae NRRL 13137]
MRDRPPTSVGTWSPHGLRQLSPRMNSSVESRIDYLVRSEYATLKFLETTTVPAPRAFDFGIAGDTDNKVGVSYILMEEMAGRTWNMQGPHGKRSADGNDKERSRISSPRSLPSKPIVSAVASDRFLVLSPSGPFATAKDYYTSFVEQNMALIADGQLFPSFPVNAYLVFLFLKSQIPNLASTANRNIETTEQFYIKHVDDKGDHLMVDDELNIVGIIDWQMARVVPANEAFGPSLVTAEMGDIYNGVSSLTVHDHGLARFLKAKGEDDLADIMRKDEKLRRFFFGLDVDFSWNETLLLIRGIWAAFGMDKNTDRKVWKTDMLDQHMHDERLMNIIDSFGAGP